VCYLCVYADRVGRMRSILLLALALCSAERAYQTFPQKLDHFNGGAPVFWNQRFSVNNTFYKEGGPVFIFLGGEANVEFFVFQEIEPLTLAEYFGALYITIEHRFYGESLPLPGYSTKDLAYLSSAQALADAAYFIETFNKTLTNPGPWVVWGCSYSGALSSWLRLKYPNLVIASVAPSGPVQAELNFTQFFAQFAISAPPACVDATISTFAVRFAV
jgi:serine protease 16